MSWEDFGFNCFLYIKQWQIGNLKPKKASIYNNLLVKILKSGSYAYVSIMCPLAHFLKNDADYFKRCRLS